VRREASPRQVGTEASPGALVAGRDFSYEYDRAGNRTRLEIDGEAFAYAPDDEHRLTSYERPALASCEYDLAGNRTSLQID